MEWLHHEYESKQFFGLVYRAEEAVVLAFTSGRFVITGATSKEGAEEALEEMKERAEL
jgi:TATA-box binding protein (TBP) (component of TFIID and TFIIIB)